MDWRIENAKDGNLTLKMNNHYLYSKYFPYKDACKWIRSEVDRTVSVYCLIGLGLGYHLKALLELKVKQPIYVYYFEEEEYNLFLENNKDDWWDTPQVKIVHDLKNLNLAGDVQLLIPNSIVKAISIDHPLHSILEVIKINTISYKKTSAKMEQNFIENNKKKNKFLKRTQYTQTRLACLVAAGPSLDETVYWLKEQQKNVDIYVVGAALKVLIQHGIVPKAVVLSDAADGTIHQFSNTKYCGDLYYLCTANYKTVDTYRGPRTILFQRGYQQAEQYAKKNNLPLVETGGSVATTTFSLLEHLNYSTIVLFGQDLGFSGTATHAEGSPSKNEITSVEFLREVEANDGTMVYTTSMFQSFWYWYKEKVKSQNIKVYNTALKGVKIPGVPNIVLEEFRKLIYKGENING